MTDRGAPRRRLVVYADPVPSDRWDSPTSWFHDVVIAASAIGWVVTCITAAPLTGQAYVAALRRRGIAVFPDEVDVEEDLLSATTPDLIAFAGLDATGRYLPAARHLAPQARMLVACWGADQPKAMSSGAVLLRQADGVLTDARGTADSLADVVAARASVHVIPESGADERPVPSFGDRAGMLVATTSATGFGDLLGILRSAAGSEPIFVVGCAPADDAATTGGLRFVGGVPELSPYVRTTKLLVVIGHAGANRLAIGSLVAGTPVVRLAVPGQPATSSVHGEECVEGGHALMARAADLMSDPTLWQEACDIGRSQVAARHSPDATRRALAAAFHEALVTT